MLMMLTKLTCMLILCLLGLHAYGLHIGMLTRLTCSRLTMLTIGLHAYGLLCLLGLHAYGLHRHAYYAYMLTAYVSMAYGLRGLRI